MTGNVQAFSTEEFRGRVRNVKANMEKQGLDVLLIHSPENIYYLTGHQTSGYFAYQVLVVTQEHEDPTLLLRYLERGNVDEYSWLDDAETWREGDNVIDRTAEVVNSLHDGPGNLGLEKRCWFLTALAAEQIVAGLGRFTVKDASYLVDRIRVAKSPAEIGYIREAGAIAEIEQRASQATINPGITEATVAAAVLNAGVGAGCEYTGLPHHIMSGYRYNVCHANWGPKLIERGELVFTELYGCRERYHATQMRTVLLGEPADKLREAVDLVIASQDAQLAAMKAGASSVEIDALVRAPIRKIRPDYFNRSGYSTGIGFPPRTAEWDVLDFNEQEDWELKEGMVFHMLALAEGFGISETVVVTETGIERLTPSNPRELILK